LHMLKAIVLEWELVGRRPTTTHDIQ
jgi:hypothetical protein